MAHQLLNYLKLNQGKKKDENNEKSIDKKHSGIQRL